MLHRAATTAYSWWWASHIRTKQSKWLEQNLVDMEDRVQGMMKIIDQEGDSFAKRAEMYYKKRPELIQFVEDTYRAYRALAERYDHLSKDLQSANRTIATVFPEQIQLSIDSDEGSMNPSPEMPFKSAPDPKNFPKAPKLPKLPPQSLKGESIIASRKEQLRRSANNAASAVSAKASGLTKEEAVIEIDVLHKDILALQTEKEFLKSSYETGLAKFCEIEGKVSEMQVRVNNLQDEFDIGTVMEDHEARSLMAATALTSCTEALKKLQGEQERSMEEVKAECARIQEAHQKLEALTQEVTPEERKNEPFEPKSFDLLTENVESEEDLCTDSLKQKIMEKLSLDGKAALTEPELADKIDDLVEKIVVLETTIFTQNGMVKRLRQYIDELLQHITDLEGNKEAIAQESDKVKRILELEKELSKVKSLNQDLVEQKNNLNIELTEANCNLDHLKEKLEDVRPADEVEELSSPKEAETEAEKDIDAHHKEIDLISHDVHYDYRREDEEEKEMIKSEAGDSGAHHDTEVQDLKIEDKGGLNWRMLYTNNIEERERILVEEYTVILRDYKDLKIKLSEADQKNREHIFELASHARELRNTIVSKDEEIQLLRRKLDGVLQGNSEENVDISSLENSRISMEENQRQQQEEEHHEEQQQQESHSQGSSESGSDRMPLFHHLYDPRTWLIPRSISISESTAIKSDPHGESDQPGSTVQARLRAELNDLLEGNLDFWLRFSTSFHQIQKFQAITKDLQAELSQLRDPKNQNKHNSQALQSEARPLYKHLREIQTEMTLWLEHSSVFQDELRNRFSSLENIQEEIIKVSNAKREKSRTSELSDFQAAKFQGEVLNMKQENRKVKEEQQAGIQRVKQLKLGIEKELVKLDKDFKLSESKRSASGVIKAPLSKSRIPLHTFLFGVKLKKNKHKH